MHRDLDPPPPLGPALCNLPAQMQPYDWHEFRRRARGRDASARGLAGGQVFALAAVIVLTAGAVWMRFGGSPLAPGAASPQVAADARLALRAAAMEQYLASLPSEPAVMRVGTRAAVTGLEDRIAELDDLLTSERVGPAQPARLRALQQERTRLIGTLVQVRYAETLAAASR